MKKTNCVVSRSNSEAYVDEVSPKDLTYNSNYYKYVFYYMSTLKCHPLTFLRV